jgi:NADPH:quinone reductase-like Zn-dependent oxidoreductase
MPQAVRYEEFGGIDVLKVVEVERPVPGAGQVLVRAKAAGINPGEASIRDVGRSRTCGRQRSLPVRAATSPVSSRSLAMASRVSLSATKS